MSSRPEGSAAYRCECEPDEYCAADDCHGATAKGLNPEPKRGVSEDSDNLTQGDSVRKDRRNIPTVGMDSVSDRDARNAAKSLFADRDEHQIGSDYGRGWIELTQADEGLRLAVCARGYGHDEPPTFNVMRMTWEEVAELRDALSEALPEGTEPSETRQWNSPICDGCGEPIRTENDRNAGGYYVRRFGRRVRKSGTWHRAHTPKEFYDQWGRW